MKCHIWGIHSHPCAFFAAFAVAIPSTQNAPSLASCRPWLTVRSAAGSAHLLALQVCLIFIRAIPHHLTSCIFYLLFKVSLLSLSSLYCVSSKSGIELNSEQLLYTRHIVVTE